MISKEHILSLAAAHLGDGPVFVTGVGISSDNHINVFLDGDEGVTIKDCVSLSRAIESALDGDKENFSLDVSSHGATSPLLMPRQYKKHMGRTFEVKLLDGTKTEGDLAAIHDDQIELESTTRENKPVGKGKVTVTKRQNILWSQIKEARIKLKY